MGSDFNVIFQEVGSKELTISFYKIYTFTLYLEYIFRDKFQFNVFEDVRNKARMKYG